MVNIAIVDDDEKMCELVKKEVDNTLNDEYEFRTHIFGNAEILLKSLHTFYDILLLDIDMPGINGIETSKVLQMNNLKTIIIFITSKSEYMPEAFGLNIFGFIEKKNLKANLPTMLMKCMKFIEGRVNLTFKTKEGFVKILTDDIIYAEVSNRKVILHTQLGEYAVNLSNLSDFYHMVDKQDFIYINRGVIINLYHLVSIANKEAKLKGIKESIQISKEKEVKEALLNYISKRGII
ncbi:MAG: LytTR family DNA-binding domain-containing protein [Erysipelotrichaceae bacterium]|uniref:LytR/AlgR family response regulator transcription factor n=1 Tax=Anaerorhabdus sp. TaxID=1872524 RepID=UPI002FCCB12B